MTSKINAHIGSSLDDFLKYEGLYEDATNYASKHVSTWKIENARLEQNMIKVEKDIPQGLKLITS